MEGNGKTVCMISSMHTLFDDRIYWKECLSLQKHGYKVCHIGFSDSDKEYISKEGIHIVEIGRKRYFKNAYIDKFYRIISLKENNYKKILSAAEKVKADVYHTHDLQINRLHKKLKQFQHKPKLIYDVHEYYPDMILSFFKNHPLWVVFKIYSLYIKYWEINKSKYCDFIITAYPKIENHFLKYHQNIPTEIIYNFTTLTPKDNSSISKKYDVIYIGAINKNRGIFQIIKTANLLKSQGRKLKILVLGPFHHIQTEQKAKKLIDTLKLHDIIEIHKPVTYEKVEAFLSQSKIALSIFLPVKVYFYAIQIKTFEYMANGLPVVCSNFGTVNKFISESKSGIPVNPLNIHEVANAITFLLDNPHEYMEMSKNGIEAVKTKYSWEQMEINLLNIYKKTLN